MTKDEARVLDRCARINKRERLLASVREDIDNAKENGYDFFGDPHAEIMAWDDAYIASDIVQCTGGYSDVYEADLIAAVAAVRKERQP